MNKLFKSFSIINVFTRKISTTNTNNDCKITIVQRLAALELKKHLISRFGPGQLESKILSTDAGKNFLSTVAYFYSYSNFYSKGTNITQFPLDNIPNLEQIKVENKEISWLIDRITQPSSEDHVPKSHFPSLLLNYTMQWPFQPNELDDFRTITSMYKFPFYKPTVDNIPEKSERFNPHLYDSNIKNLIQNIRLNDFPSSQSIDTNQNLSDERVCGDYELPNYKSEKNLIGLSSNDYIFSPSEMEVIQSDHLLHFDKCRSKR